MWALFVACIVAIPLAAWRGEHRAAAWFAAIVAAEVIGLPRLTVMSAPSRSTARRATCQFTSHSAERAERCVSAMRAMRIVRVPVDDHWVDVAA
jgi:hypothetical protein